LFGFVVPIQKGGLLAAGDKHPGLMPDPGVYDFADVGMIKQPAGGRGCYCV
jgi:hypothetical protein